VNPGLRNFDSLPDLGHRMKARILIFGFFVATVTSAHAGSVSYAQCGTYDSYLFIYRTTQKFEEVGKLRCEEKVEVLSRSEGYSQIRTLDGRVGWVHDADLSETPPPPRRKFSFGLTEVTPEVQPKPAPSPIAAARHSDSYLTNADIMAMFRERADSDAIVKKIKSSRCAFDTTPESLLQLKASGLTDKVILTMLAAPDASETPEQRTSESVDVRIPDGTPLEVELNGSVWAEGVREGMIVEMLAAEDLVVNGVPVILRGAEARARVIAVKEPGSHGGSGEVAWFMQDVVSVSGDRIPVTFASKQPGNNHTRNFEGYSYFSSEFHKGSPAIKATNQHFRVVTHGDTVLSVSQSLTADVPGPAPKTQSARQAPAQPEVLPVAAPSPQPSTPGEAQP
jgi:SH3 domain-containing protein